MGRTLAEAFGIKDIRKTDPQPEPVEVGDLSGPQFARTVVNSNDFREYLLRQISFDELHPSIIIRLMEYAWGKPTEHVIIEHSNPYEGMTLQQIAERAESLRAIVQQQHEDEQSDEPSSVH